jgi:hypothetical protein
MIIRRFGPSRSAAFARARTGPSFGADDAGVPERRGLGTDAHSLGTTVSAKYAGERSQKVR